MISSSIAVWQPGYLRHQLRDVLRNSRHNASLFAPPKAFFTQTVRCQEASEAMKAEQSAPTTTNAKGTSTKPTNVVRKSSHPSGEIIIRKGLRQRITSKRISRDSLDKPSYVIVFQDETSQGPDSRSARSRRTRKIQKAESDPEGDIITTEPIEADNGIHSRKPAQMEINQSIDTLKPRSSIVDKNEYERLLSTLMQSYNMVQLRRYLLANVGRSRWNSQRRGEPDLDAEDHISALNVGEWHAGRTPLEVRPQRQAKQLGSSNKTLVARNILRLAWSLVVQSEQQEMGELEFGLEPWQLQLLFDVEIDGRPQFESLLSQAQIKASDIRPYRPDCILRITARRQDADEISRKLQLALVECVQSKFDLTVFSSLLGQPGWPSRLNDLFKEDDLQHVTSTTGVLVKKETDFLGIYSFKKSMESHVQRLLLSLLSLPGACSYYRILADSELNSGTLQKQSNIPSIHYLPVSLADSRVHRRYQNRHLVRQVAPVHKQRPDASRLQIDPTTIAHLTSDSIAQSGLLADGTRGSAEISKRFVEDIAAAIGNAPSPYKKTTFITTHEDSYWGATIKLKHQNWRTHFCKLLQDEGSLTTADGDQLQSEPNAPKHIPLHEVPGAESLLSFFDEGIQTQNRRIHRMKRLDRRRFSNSLFDARLPNLVAHFIPSPFTSAGSQVLAKLPKLELRYRIAQSTDDQAYGPLELYGARAILDEQYLAVPLPARSVDALITRGIFMFADRRMMLQDPGIKRFTEQLRASFQQAPTLSAIPELDFMLPRWLVRGETPDASSSKHPDVPVPYLFERFEQLQSYDMVPTHDAALLDTLDPVDRTLIEGFSKNCHVEYRQVEGGPINGSETYLTLRTKPGATIVHHLTSEGTEDTEPLRGTALNASAPSTDLSPSGAHSQDSASPVVDEKRADTSQPREDAASLVQKEDSGALQGLEDATAQSEKTWEVQQEIVSALEYAQAAIDISTLLTRADAGQLARPVQSSDVHAASRPKF